MGTLKGKGMFFHKDEGPFDRRLLTMISSLIIGIDLRIKSYWQVKGTTISLKLVSGTLSFYSSINFKLSILNLKKEELKLDRDKTTNMVLHPRRAHLF